jgi:pimeloyl-ACP methyl ester carboxylesterase
MPITTPKRRRAARCVVGLWLIAACACVVVAVGCPNYVPALTFEVREDIAYGQGWVSNGRGGYMLADLLLDAYVPDDPGDGPRPAMVLIHGGGFTEGDKRKEEIVDYAEFFARRGFVCFSIDYRKTEDGPPAPGYTLGVNLFEAAHAAFVDAKSAVRYVRANAAAYNVDPNMIIVLGESAGAFSALTVAVTDEGDYYRDSSKFPLPEANHPDVSSEVQGCIDLWGSGDHLLLEFGPGDPPIMVLHGEEDDEFFTPFGAAERIHYALELWNIPHEFYAIEDAGHGAWNARVNGKPITILIVDFLNEHVL